MITKYNHHGTLVSVEDELKGKHREHCLCFKGCNKFKPNPNDGSNCPIAQALYEFDVKYSLTTPVWECPVYEKDTE